MSNEMVFNSSSAGVDRRAQDYIAELVHELLLEAGIDPCAFGWELVVSWEAEES